MKPICNEYDKDGDAPDRPCGYNASSTCRFSDHRYYCPVQVKLYHRKKARAQEKALRDAEARDRKGLLTRIAGFLIR